MDRSTATSEHVNEYENKSLQRDRSASDTASEHPSASDSEELDLDCQNQPHIDTSSDGMYRISGLQINQQFIAVNDGRQAIEAMRSCLQITLPSGLIQDEYENPVSIGLIPPRYLAKLQAKVWRELPAMVARASSRLNGERWETDDITARTIYWLSTHMFESK